MIISVDDNRKFNGLLGDIRAMVSPTSDGKSFRKDIKDLDPNFPLAENGTDKISMRDITQEEFDDHLSFVKTMCIRQGIRMDYFTEADVVCAKEATFSVEVSNQAEELDDKIIVGVVCSNCGCETIRGLTDDRYEEAKAIALGDKKESFTPLSESFLCVNCINIKLKEDADAR